MRTGTKYRWSVVAIFFFFMLLHQSDKLLIGPLTTDIMKTFGLTRTEMGAVFTGALVVGAIFYPLWGYLYDRYARSRLLALASFLWGCSTWLSAIAPTFSTFLVTRASTGIDDSSYPGLYSLISDLFPPNVRGKIYGLLQLTMPLGYLLGMLMALMLGGVIGWRSVFYITGSLGVLLSIVIFFGVKETPRGKSEPEMADLAEVGTYQFNWKTARDLFKKRTLIMIVIQGFFGVFPWNVITYWFFDYLAQERGYAQDSMLFTMVPAVLIMAAGYPLGGGLGDFLFKRTPRGRAIVATFGVVAGAILLWFTMQVPLENQTEFMILLGLTALFIPFASANVVATVYDITLPEVRSTANAVENFIESIGAALAPLLAGVIADASTLGNAILIICLSAWAVCALFFVFVMFVLPKDVQELRSQMRDRAEHERLRQTAVQQA
ncbi:MAG TPA: MFS transporter [Anaerolineaceae bacterium]|nr:MFS transporter [Anaerolineaceae bacterium]